MASVYIASSLSQYAEGERFLVLQGSTVEDVLHGLTDRYPRFGNYVFDGEGSLRPHVNLFCNARVVPRTDLNTSIQDGDELAIIAAIAGG